MKTISDLRKAIKPFNVKLKVQTLSFGKTATYLVGDTKDSVDSVLMMLGVAKIAGKLNEQHESLLDNLLAFANWRKDNAEVLSALRQETGIIGLQ